ncbi:MAG: Fibronectin type domain protein [Solirubrobacterales bacterium]|nr:Fibronectin type domain protein [Solirubrobacterales bacterium]
MLDRSADGPDAAGARTSNSQSRCFAASRAVHGVADAPGTVLTNSWGGAIPLVATTRKASEIAGASRAQDKLSSKEGHPATMPQRVAFTAAVGHRVRPAMIALLAAITALALSMGASTDRALAGGVDLTACASDGAENLFDFADWSGGSVYAGHACPANYSTQGVMSRTTGAAAVANWTAAAIFRAPLGTSITDIHGDINIVDDQVGASGWTAGLTDESGYWFYGGPGNASGVYSSYGQWVPFDYNVGSLQQFALSAVCVWASCPSKSGNPYAYVTMRNIRVHLVDFSVPDLTNGRGQLWTTNAASEWLSGVHSAGFDAGDNMGIKRAWIDIDGGLAKERVGGCDYHLRKPCDDYPTILDLDTAGLSDGYHTVTIKAQDAADNVNALSHTFRVDNHAPDKPSTPTLAGAAASTWRTTNSFTVNYANPGTGGGSPNSSSDVQVCKVDPVTGNADESQCMTPQSGAAPSGTNTFGVPTTGEFKARVRVHDALYTGAWSDWSPRLRFDDTVPGQAREPHLNGWINNAEAQTFTIQPPNPAQFAHPASGIAGYAVTKDGSTPGAAITDPAGATSETATVSLSGLPNGVNTIKARAISGAGLPATNANVESQDVKIDRLPPTPDASGSTGAGWSNADVTLTMTASDQPTLSGMGAAAAGQPYSDGAYLTYEVDGGSAQHIRGGSGSITLSEDGSHVVVLHATDLAGNLSAAKTVRVNIDHQPPVADATGDTGSGWSRGDVTVGMGGTDQAGLSGMGGAPSGEPYTNGAYLTYEVDGGTAQHIRGGSGSLTLTDDGTHLVTVHATDVAGNAGTRKTVNVNIDRRAPQVTLTGVPQDGVLLNTPATVKIAATDDVSGMSNGSVDYQLDDADVRTISGATTTVSVPSDGNHMLRTRAIDTAGNTSEWHTTSFVDKTPPNGGLELQDHNNPRLISFYVSEACIKSASIELRQPGGEWIPLETTTGDHHITATIPQDIYDQRGTFEVRALVTDCAGNPAILDKQYGGPNDGQSAVGRLDARAGMLLMASFIKDALKPCSALKKVKPKKARTTAARKASLVAAKRNARATGQRCARSKGNKQAAPRAAAAATVDTKKKNAKQPGGKTSKTATTPGAVLGVLTAENGVAAAGQAVDIQVRPHTATSQWKTIATARTDANGKVQFGVPKSPSLYVRLVFRHTEDLADATSATLETAVAATSTIKANKRRLHNQQTARFSGRLAGGYLPAGGREVELQGFNPVKHKWVPVKTAGLKADDKGRWKATYKFTATHRPTIYKFRLRISARSDYPFAGGYSKSVKLSVTP